MPSRIDVNDLLGVLAMEYAECDRSRFKLTECKSNAKAIEYRSQGNTKYMKSVDDTALTLYTQSIAWAVDGSEELALAYGNRSAVLFRISKYRLCLFDINRALDGKYPKDKRQKLFDRKKECLMRIRESENSLERVKANATGPSYAREYSEEDLVQWRNACKFGNALIPGASPKIKLAYDEKWGRHMVAAENIEPGDILSSQKFFVLTPKNSWENCSFCLAKCEALIPCSSCSKMMYCSEHCLKQAYDMYHRIECKMMAFEEISTAKVEFEPLRMLLCGTKQGADLKKFMKKLKMSDIFAEEVDFSKKPFKNDYLSVINLSKNYDFSLVFENIFSAVESTIMLEKTEFFVESGYDSDKTETLEDRMVSRLYVMMLLINNSIVHSKNEFAVGSLHHWDEYCTKIGSGLCILHTFINHSCNPNVRWLTRDREHVILAVRPIRKGDQILTPYVPVFSLLSGEERATRLLSSYGFICECEACINQWPMMAVGSVQFRTQNVKQAMEDLRKIMSLVCDGNVQSMRDEEVLQIICNTTKWVYTNMNEPALSFLRECEDLILKFISSMYDDHSQEYTSEMKAFAEEVLRGVMVLILDSYYLRERSSSIVSPTFRLI